MSRGQSRINRRHRSHEDIREDQKTILARYGITDTLDVYVELKTSHLD